VEDFEFLRNVTIGQYFQGDSIVHRLDPRTKITVLVILAIVNSFVISFTGNVLLLALGVRAAVRHLIHVYAVGHQTGAAAHPAVRPDAATFLRS
jgi:hypothetical protein